jgi:cytochrome c553
MKTPVQDLMDEFAKKADSLPDTLDANAAYLVFQECYDMAKSMLEKEKEVMIDFAYKFGDEPLLEIAKWYDKQFNTEEK